MNTVQTSEPESEALVLCRHGITIRKRSGRQNEKYTTRIRFRGAVHYLTLAETAKESFDQAIRARREIHAGRWAELKASIAMRQPVHSTTEKLFATYRQFTGLDRPAETTREQNIHALESLLRDVLGPDTDIPSLSLARYTADLVWKWKEHKRQLAGRADDDERATQILRSANSRLRQARSLFSDNDDLRKFYQHHQLLLPDTIAAFCAEPGFADCAKTEYHAPTDQIIAATFAALEALVHPPSAEPFSNHLAAWRAVQCPDTLNMYKAIWLALGFGLRLSEISQARVGWFENVSGAIFCRGDVLAKNKKFPEVRCQLGAWSRLAPFLDGHDKDEYVLAGHATERSDNCFRRISEWMRVLGWQTTHHLHEFRAWAGCQIAMAPGGRGLLDAQVFMRHASFATTEKYYGHHLKIRLQEVTLQIPIVAQPKTFTPVLLPAAG